MVLTLAQPHVAPPVHALSAARVRPVTRSHSELPSRAVTCSAYTPDLSRRQLLFSASLLAAATPAAAALADDDIIDSPVDALVSIVEQSEEDVRFGSTDLVKRLLESSEKNKDSNKKALLAKYCARQAEDGVGDCAGLRYIPGATKNGKQKTPGWLKSILRIEDKDDE